MKQPKKLTREQKEIIARRMNYDWNDWMLAFEDKSTFTIIHKEDKNRQETYSY